MVVGSRRAVSTTGKVRESALLQTLHRDLRSTATEAFDCGMLAVEERFNNAWFANPDEGWELLRSAVFAGDNRIASCIMAAAANKLSEDDISTIAHRNSFVAIQLASQNFSLATLPSLWTCHEISVLAIGPLIAHGIESDNQFATAVVRAQILARRNDSCDEMESLLGPRIVPAVLGAGVDAVKAADQQRPSSWDRVLGQYPKEILAWLHDSKDVTNESAIFSTLGLDPNNETIGCELIKIWHYILKEVPDLTYDTVLHSRIILICAAFDNDVHETQAIVRKTFPLVYDAALEDRISQRDWNLLNRRLPDVGYGWDRCKQLREGLLQLSLRRQLSTEAFVQCIPSGEMLDQILSSWRWSSSERSFLATVVSQIIEGKTPATEEQRAVANRIAASYW
jgi:hypothetical protein